MGTFEVGVHSEYGPLQKVIIQRPSSEQERVIPWAGSHALLDSLPISSIIAQGEYDQYEQFLHQEIGKDNVLHIDKLLAQVFENAGGTERRKMLFEMGGHHGQTNTLRYIGGIAKHGWTLDKMNSAQLVGDIINGHPRNLEVVDGVIPPLNLKPKRTLMWARDAVAVTPIGAIICSMAKPARQDEPAVLRTIFKYHPDFGEHTIALDLQALERQDGRRRILEGGNVQVYGHVVALGMGDPSAEYSSRSNPAGLEAVTRKLLEEKDNGIDHVIHAYIPDIPIHIHLDSGFNMVGPKAAVAMPYIYGYPDKPEHVFGPLRHRLETDMRAAGADMTLLPKDTDYKRWGSALVYTRRSLAAADDFASAGKEVRFLDHLGDEGLLKLNEISWVGGEQSHYSGPIQHLISAMNEQASLGANVFCTGPDRAIAYQRNLQTNNDLFFKMRRRNKDFILKRMDSNEHRTTWGGPHCMAVPLSRALVN